MIYERTGSTWVLAASLLGSNTIGGNYFGARFGFSLVVCFSLLSYCKVSIFQKMEVRSLWVQREKEVQVKALMEMIFKELLLQVMGCLSRFP